MALIQARVKLTNGDGKIYVKDSPVLNVNNKVSALPNNLRSDKLLVIGGSMNLTNFYFVAGDKVLVEKTTTTTYPGVVTLSGVTTVTKTGWFSLSDIVPAGFRESESLKKGNTFTNTYFIEPVEYAGDRYYSTSGSLKRISSVDFCKRLIFAASELAPAGIRDPYASMYYWGETNPDTGETALVIPATMDDISGLFDGGATIGAYGNIAPMPKIITLGKIKKMHRTFYNAFAYGMITYTPPLDAVVFGEMDVSEVTDFSYCFGQCFQANPDIENWDVSSATNMTGMFAIVVDWTTDRWTRNLSKWCVSKIASEPANFSTNHPMSAAQKPVWGTCPIKGIVSEGDIGLYRHYWGSDANLQQRRVNQIYVGSQIKVSPSGGVTGSSFTRSGVSNGFKWECSNKAAPITNSPGGFIVNALLTDTTIVYGDGTNISTSLGLPITITRLNGDGVLHKSITIVFRNLRTNILHSFTFQRGVSYGTGGTYHENTSQFKDLKARIAAIGEYGDRVEIESVLIEPSNG